MLGSLGFLIYAFFSTSCLSKQITIAEGVLSASIIGVTAIIAVNTYLHSRKVENAKALLEIRKILSSDENMAIHKFIGEHKEKDYEAQEESEEFYKFWSENKYRIYDYLGTLELINILIDSNVITVENFQSQFGYRLRNITKYKELINKIEKQQSNYQGWNDLIKLMKLANPQYKH